MGDIRNEWKGKKKMTVYETRKEADEVRKTDSYHRSDERIVKVEGGYTLMTEEEYRVWKNQK